MIPVVFPDSELQLTGGLRAALPAGTYVDIRIPSTRRPREVIVRRDGGPEGLIIARQRFGFRVFAPSEKEVSDLADLTSANVRALRFTGHFRDISTTSPFPVEDQSGIPCRYFTAEIAARGTPLSVP